MNEFNDAFQQQYAYGMPNEGGTAVFCDSKLASQVPLTRVRVPITATSQYPVRVDSTGRRSAYALSTPVFAQATHHGRAVDQWNSRGSVRSVERTSRLPARERMLGAMERTFESAEAPVHARRQTATALCPNVSTSP
jgi:hypothetical protein